MKTKFIEAYMDVAKRFSQLSYAQRLKVGAIIVKDDRIVAYGYNGMPSGWDNRCEDEYQYEDGGYETRTRPEVIHAEANAIAKLARSNESGDHASIYITHAPCVECAKLIYTSGIHNVYYKNEYRNEDGIKFLHNCGLKVIKHD